MDKLEIFKNKGEVFKFDIEIEGADSEDAMVRMCLEFDDDSNKNLFFYGKLTESQCIISLPRLTELENCTGTLYVEAVCDSMYFKLYESNFELKNSVEIKMKKNAVVKEHEIKETKIKINNLQREHAPLAVEKNTVEEEIIDSTTNDHTPNKGLKSFVESLRKR